LSDKAPLPSAWNPAQKVAGMRILPLLGVLSLFVLAGCHPATLKTIDLPSTSFQVGRNGFPAAKGSCLSVGNPPLSPFSPGAGEALVGFDDFFKPGAPPLPCDSIRVTVFRTGVLFDVTRFDSVAGASLLFDTSRSVVRTGGNETDGATSVATVLGMGTMTFSSAMPYTNETALTPGSGPQNIGVSSQVRAWITHAQPNFGFVIAGPHDADQANPPSDNDAGVSFYTNFRLRILYNPAQNPRAPQ
jgi:hypothetical protein